MKRVFVDSGAWYANLVAEDADHEAAALLFDRAREENWVLVTTNAVLFETYALLVNRAQNGRELAIGLLDKIHEGLARLIRLRKRDEQRAIELVRRHEDKTYSLCDASSFVVMERARIREALAFDRHFRQYGGIRVNP